MLVTEISDPRLQVLFGKTEGDRSARPIVRLPSKGLPPALFGIIAIVSGVLLFSVLNERRTNQPQPSVRANSEIATHAWPAPPPLFIPPADISDSLSPAEKVSAASPVVAGPAPTADHPFAPFQSTDLDPPSPQPYRPAPNFGPIGAPARDEPILIDEGGSVRSIRPLVDDGDASSGDRVRSSALANPSLTVAQGTLIQAVLETGFDSTRPGFARAVVSRDVRSFEGNKVLIPRGSRLIGESRAPAVQGQKSVVITWTRLIRPDGVTIEMDSPATDTVGRGGIPASVNTHFLSRVGSALGRAVDVFSQVLAARAGPLLILPGIGDATKPQTPSHQKPAPTLKVAPGTSITVFVAHDLDFSGAGA